MKNEIIKKLIEKAKEIEKSSKSKLRDFLKSEKIYEDITIGNKHYYILN